MRDYEDRIERLMDASEPLRRELEREFPLLKQLLGLAIQMLIAWLAGMLRPPTPPLLPPS
jgi:hypothetical protein